MFFHSEIMNAHEEFYANLFSRGEIDPNIQSELLSNISRAKYREQFLLICPKLLMPSVIQAY